MPVNGSFPATPNEINACRDISSCVRVHLDPILASPPLCSALVCSGLLCSALADIATLRKSCPCRWGYFPVPASLCPAFVFSFDFCALLLPLPLNNRVSSHKTLASTHLCKLRLSFFHLMLTLFVPRSIHSLVSFHTLFLKKADKEHCRKNLSTLHERNFFGLSWSS